MPTSTYIVFRLHGALYGMPSTAVEEIFSLPELVPIAEAPSYIAGILSVRGAVTPVVDLDRRLGRGAHRPVVTDVVILVRIDGHCFGVIADEVLEVRSVAREEMGPVPAYAEIDEMATRFISGIAATADGLMALIDPPTLLRASGAVIELEDRDPEEASEEGAPEEGARRKGGSDGDDRGREDVDREENAAARFAPDATEEDRRTFRERAEALRHAPEEREENRIGLALFRLGGETFAVEIGSVREFAAIGEITPVPCTPSKIIGQMNLRGEIVTLVDVRSALTLPLAPLGSGAKAIVIGTGELHAAVAADELFDVIYMTPEEITPAPLATRSVASEYVTGTLNHAGTIATVIDLAEMFRRGEFDVEEEVV